MPTLSQPGGTTCFADVLDPVLQSGDAHEARPAKSFVLNSRLIAVLLLLSATCALPSTSLAQQSQDIARCNSNPNLTEYCRELAKGAISAEERDAIDWTCVAKCKNSGGIIDRCIQQCPVPPSD